jgi:hypothetical protein
MDFERFLGEAVKEAKHRFRTSGSVEHSWRHAVDVWIGFYKAVDWSEPWLRVLLGAHIALLLAIGLTRKSERYQLGMFAFCSITVFGAERINTYGRMHWEEFATQNYFDEQGRFISVVLSTPLLISAVCILVNILFIMTSMMVAITKRRRDHGVKKTQ